MTPRGHPMLAAATAGGDIYEQLWHDAKLLFDRRDIPPEFLDLPIPVCIYDEGFMRFIGSLRRGVSFIVKEETVWITHNTSVVHQRAQHVIVNSIAFQLSSNSQSQISHDTSGSILLASPYFCGNVREKYYDGAVYLYEEARRGRNPRLVLEVAFTHETLSDLLLECAHYLTVYVPDTIYSIGVYIRPSRTRFEVTVFVLERLLPSSLRLADHIRNLYRGPRTDPGICQKIFHPTFPVTGRYCKEMLNVGLVLFQTLIEQEILDGRAFVFQLDGRHFDRNPNTNIEIPNSVLRDIYDAWREWNNQ